MMPGGEALGRMRRSTECSPEPPDGAAEPSWEKDDGGDEEGREQQGVHVSHWLNKFGNAVTNRAPKTGPAMVRAPPRTAINRKLIARSTPKLSTLTNET